MGKNRKHCKKYNSLALKSFDLSLNAMRIMFVF